MLELHSIAENYHIEERRDNEGALYWHRVGLCQSMKEANRFFEDYKETNPAKALRILRVTVIEVELRYESGKAANICSTVTFS